MGEPFGHDPKAPAQHNQGHPISGKPLPTARFRIRTFWLSATVAPYYFIQEPRLMRNTIAGDSVPPQQPQHVVPENRLSARDYHRLWCVYTGLL